MADGLLAAVVENRVVIFQITPQRMSAEVTLSQVFSMNTPESVGAVLRSASPSYCMCTCHFNRALLFNRLVLETGQSVPSSVFQQMGGVVQECCSARSACCNACVSLHASPLAAHPGGILHFPSFPSPYLIFVSRICTCRWFPLRLCDVVPL